MTENDGPAGLRPVPDAPGLARRLWGWALDYTYVSYWMVPALLRRGSADQFLHPPGRPDVPVLLIPGVYENWRFLQPVAAHLHRAGHPVHVLDELGYNTGAIPDMAEITRDYLRALDLTEVVVVAHSKGGLIAKYALAEPDILRRVRHVITVNTPFSGSRYASLFLLPSVRMFAPNGPVIRQLRDNLEVNSKITSLYSVFDPHIPETSYLEGAENIVLPGIGHFRPLGDPETLRLIDAVLHRADPATEEPDPALPSSVQPAPEP